MVQRTVEDGKGGTAWTNFTITVQNVNDPPTISTIDITTATEDVLYQVSYAASDIDPTADENLEKPCGRGIMLMRCYMDKIEFSPQGNEVFMVKNRQP